MRRRSKLNRVRYWIRARWRALLAWWCGLQELVAEWWESHICGHEAEPRVVIYPRRGLASRGQVAEFRVLRTSKDVSLAEAAESYLRLVERISGPFPKVTQ